MAETAMASGRIRRVLLVADDALLVGLWKGTLRLSGLLAESVNCLALAHQVLDAWSAEWFDYAFVDDWLPDGLGAGIWPRLATLMPRPRVAIVSAHPTCERWLQAARSGVSLVPRPECSEDVLQLLHYLDATPALPANAVEASGAVEATALVLTEEGLLTRNGLLPLRRGSRLLLSQLLRCAGKAVPAHELAQRLFGREDIGAHDLVRRHVADLRAALGAYRTLIATVAGQGYRLAPGRIVSQTFSELPATALRS